MSKSTRILLLVGILIIATFLRFYHFTTVPPGLYPDEAMNGNNAAEVAATGQFKVFYPEDNGREGLYVNLVALEFMLFHAPHAAWAVRLPAAVAGVLTVLGLYLLVAELFGDGPGLLAAFLLATSFWHINFSRIAFRAILSPLFLTWALWLLIKAFRAARARAAWWYAAAAGAVYALGFYTYIAYRVTPLLLLLFIPFFRKNPDFWKRVAVFAAAAFIVAAPIGLYFVQNPGAFFGRTGEISVTASANPLAAFAVNLGKTALELNVHGDYNWRQNVAGAPELFWPVGLLFLLGLGLALYWMGKYWRERRRRRDDAAGRSADAGRPMGFAGNFQHLNAPFGLWLALGWLILGALPAAISNEGIPHALRSILMVVPAMILAAVGGAWLYRLIKKHWGIRLAKLLAFLLLATIAIFGYVDYFVTWAQNPNVPGAFNADYVAIGNAMNALPASAPKYVVVNAGGVIVRGLPTPAETVIFITNSFTTSTRAAQNIYYLLPDQTSTIPAGTPSGEIFDVD